MRNSHYAWAAPYQQETAPGTTFGLPVGAE